MKPLILAAVMAAATPFAAMAQNIALVVVNGDYDTLRDIRNGSFAEDTTRLLAGAGFEVTQLVDAPFIEATAALSQFRAEVLAADRVLVVLAGHVVSDGERSWLLTSNAESPDAFTVGAQGLPIEPVLAMLSEQQGTSAVLLAVAGEPLRLGGGLFTGSGTVEAPQGVVAFVGPTRGISSTLRDLLEPGQSFAETANGLPSSVEASGFLSRSVSFLPEGSGESSVPQPVLQADPIVDVEAVETVLGLDREERRSVQRNLQLLGYDPRGIDGIFGRGTRTAIRDWQASNGFEGTGYLSGNQIVLLQEQGERRARELEAEAAARQVELDRRDTAYWRETGETGTEEGLRAYLARHPDGLYAERARELLEPFEEARREQAERADREAWDIARAEDTTEGYRRYLDRYPDGAFRQEAEARLDALTRDTAPAEALAEENRVAGNMIVRLLIEQRLQQLGAEPGRVDGVFDEETRRAIRRFQRARDLPVTGYVTQAMMAQLLA